VRLGVDMDEVLTDTLGKQLRVYNAQYGTNVQPEQLDGCELLDIVPPEQRRCSRKTAPSTSSHCRRD